MFGSLFEGLSGASEPVAIGLEELHRRLCSVRTLVSVASQQADDHCTFREHLEAARVAVDYLLRDLGWEGPA